MNKIKKLAMAAVAVVMAGSMVFSFTACDNTNTPGPNPTPTPTPTPDDDIPTLDGVGIKVDRGTKPALDASLTPKVDSNDLPTYAANTEIKTSIGYDGSSTGIKYENLEIQNLAGKSTASQATLAGTTYVSGNLKPAWSALATKLGVTVSDTWSGDKASDQITNIKQYSSLSNYGIITASVDTIVTEATQGSFLDINQYLYYMPNYKAFLDENPIVRLSLTNDTSTGAMYMLPYFDGNNDIEKYVLMRKDIVEKLLDNNNTATGTFKSQADAKNNVTSGKTSVTVVGNKSSVESFMGKTAADNYDIDVTDPSVVTGEYNSEVTDDKATVMITVDYGAALTAAKNDTTALGAAIKDAAGTTYNGGSGNIIDLQNFAINQTNGNVTGAKLTKILQEYIKVTYHKPGDTSAFYTTLSDVFNSAYAAWDVDLYVALGRCAMTSIDYLGASVKDEGDTYFVGSRTGYTNRTYDMASMAGELYGVRGLTSRYSNMFAYIDGEGNCLDARADEEMWNALAKMNKLAQEGLYYTGTALTDGVSSIASDSKNTKVQLLSSTDYVQTQTAEGGFIADGTLSGNIEEGYNYAPVLTPVSRWNVSDKTGAVNEVVMRFTESWRGVKSEGLCLIKSYFEGQPDKLAAALAFIDYLYSNDGQLLMTYGPQSTVGNENPNGLWYAEKVENITLAKAYADGIVDTYDGIQYFVVGGRESDTVDYRPQYFCYKNELYEGRLYNGKQIPQMTDENLNIFYNISNQNFTNHARYYLGTALNLGVKDQGFEYQCTSSCGIIGADIWAIANVNGTIKHTVQTIDMDNLWYTLTPTTLPFTADRTSQMNDQYKYVSGKGGSTANFFYADSEFASNLLTDVMYFGFDTTRAIGIVSTLGLKLSANAAGIISMLNSNTSYGGMSTIDGWMNQAWLSLVTYYRRNLA